MSRLSDVLVLRYGGEWAPLPVVDWRRIAQGAPTRVAITYQGPDAPLPKADIVVLTWTSAEWSALDHVFLNSSTTRTKSSYDWQGCWYPYRRGVSPTSRQSNSGPWGYYQLVEVTTTTGAVLRVLLFKSGVHLAHAPWFQGLADMLTRIFEDAQPEWVYSIGTAGGTREDVRLGDVVITNAAHSKLHRPENVDAPINNRSFICTSSFPSTTLLASVQEQLFFHMSNVVTYPVLENALFQLHHQVRDSASFELDDLLNQALYPSNLHDPRAMPMQGTPLLTTDYYYIATGEDAAQWAVLEMDDAAIAYVAAQHGIKYAFIRNISDPLVPSATAQGETIPDDVRDCWSGLIYEDFGFYTSFNGAITTWAVITAQV